MRRQKGFTLAEILGVMVILGLLVILIAPGIINRIRTKNKEAEEAGNEIIYNGTQQYMNENKRNYPPGKSYCIRISKLIADGKLVSPVINVVTGENIEDKSVLVQIHKSGASAFSIKDNEECEEESQKEIRVATITFVKGTNTDIIGTETMRCIIKSDTNSCTITAPTITPKTGFSASNWSKTKDAKTGTEPGKSITVTEDATYYGNSIDNIKPTVTLSPKTQNDYIKGGKAVTVTVSDVGSKIPTKSQISYAWSTSSKSQPKSGWKSVTTTNTAVAASTLAKIPITATSSLTGEYYLWIKAGIKDVAGNASNKATSSVFKFDNTAPTISSIKQTDSDGKTISGWTNKKSVTVTLKGSDVGSGIETWQYITLPQVQVQGHVQNIGWLPDPKTGTVSSTIGTTGIALRLEAFTIKVVNSSIDGGIKYSVYVQNSGWQSYKTYNKETETIGIAGTIGEAKQIKAVKMELTDDLAKYYNVKYRTHRANVGWDKWVTNGTGTKNDGNRVEAIEIKIEPKSTITTTNAWKSASNSNATYTYKFTSEQDTTNYFRLCDKVGNCSGAESATIQIDRTPAIAIYYGFDYAGWVDNGCNDKYTPKKGQTTCNTHVTPTDDGLNKFEYKTASFDNLSSAEPIDKFSNKSSVKLECKWKHDGSGPKYFDWTDCSGIDWKARGSGSYRDIHLRTVDVAGNISGDLYSHLYFP